MSVNRLYCASIQLKKLMSHLNHSFWFQISSFCIACCTYYTCGTFHWEKIRNLPVIWCSTQWLLLACAAKYGTPNYRLETIFNNVPDARRLGLLHYMMTTTQTMTAEEVESRLKACWSATLTSAWRHVTSVPSTSKRPTHQTIRLQGDQKWLTRRHQSTKPARDCKTLLFLTLVVN